jgi:hypothetical protein
MHAGGGSEWMVARIDHATAQPVPLKGNLLDEIVQEPGEIT